MESPKTHSSPEEALEQKAKARQRMTPLEVLALMAILLLAALVRGAYWSEIVDHPDYASPVLDAWTHDYWARALLSGNWTPRAGIRDPEIYNTPYVRPPGYPYFLAGIYALSGGSYHAIRAVQFSLGLLNCLLLFLLGRRLWGRGVGLLGALFMGLYWGFIFFEGELQAPALVICLTLLLFLLACAWLTRLTIARGFAAGLLLGLITLFRPEVLLLIPLLPLWGWWATRKQRPRGRVWIALLACLIGAGSLIAPVTWRNYRVSGEVLLVTLGGGFNLYAGNNPDAKGTYPYINMEKPLNISRTLNNNEMPIYREALRKKLGQPQLGYADLSRYFSKLALEYIREEPLHCLHLMAQKALYYWGPYEISNNKVLMLERAHSPVLRILPGFTLAAVLAFLGLLMSVYYALHSHRTTPLLWPVGLLLVAYVFIRFASVLPFFVAGRYRIQIVPVLVLFSAYALITVAGLLRRRAWGEFKIWVPVVLALSLALGVPWLDYTPSEAMWHWSRGLAYVTKADREPEKALAEYQQAALAVGNTGTLHRGVLYTEVALTLLELGRGQEALEWSARALELYPTFAPAYNTHGFILYEQGRIQEAIPLFEKAIELDYLLITARHNLGNALVDIGENEKAVAAYKGVLEVDPEDRHAASNLGRVYARMGQHEAARDAYAQALQQHEENPAVINSLAWAIWQSGDQQTALTYLEKAHALAPEDGRVAHNLGNLLVELERYDEAIAVFEAILRQNPEDDFAEYNWGRALALAGRHAEAAEKFRAVLKDYPGHARAHNYLGYELEQLGEIEEAIMHYKAAIKISPDFNLPYENLRNLRAKQAAAPGVEKDGAGS